MPSLRWLFSMAVAATAAASVGATLRAESPEVVARLPAPAVENTTGGHEMWQVYTRHIGGCMRPPALRVSRREHCRWLPADLETLLAPFDGIVVVYVHGNRMEQNNTLNRGDAYFRCLTTEPGPRVRFVVWSWPSDQIKGQLKDLRVKATRADQEGAYVAWFLDRLDPQQRTSLIGYSYGARVISNALHIRSCGGVPGLPMSSSTIAPRVLFGAPAQPSNSLATVYRGAVGQIDRLLLFYNTRDPLLKRYGVVEKGYRPEALGYTGVRWGIPGGERIRQLDVANLVGRSHYEPNYLQRASLREEMRQCLLWQPMP